MYRVEFKLFGNYVLDNYCETYTEALEIAARLRSEGWIYVRILHPNLVITEIE